MVTHLLTDGMSFLDVAVLLASSVVLLVSVFLLRELYRRYRGRFSDQVSQVFLWMIISFAISFAGDIVEHLGEYVFPNMFSDLIVIAHVVELVGKVTFMFAVWLWWRYVK